MLKTLVTSATYRQSSIASADADRLDPTNRLMSRGPRVRVSAEMVRDQALAAAGLLSKKMYGPPVHPPRPKLGLNAAFSSSTDWEDSVGEDRYRRALYTEWRRSMPYPSMATFDAPSREVCEVKRSRTNTPLQALVTLNNPVYVEAAQGLARQMAAHGKKGELEAQAIYGFRRALVRQPSSEEVATLVDLYHRAHAELSKTPTEAQTLATNPIGPIPEGLDAVDLAAWTVVANALLNLDELLLKP